MIDPAKPEPVEPRRRGTISISEDDFAIVATAANDAQRKGDMKAAQALDKIARKINAALTAANPVMRELAFLSGRKPQAVRWSDMPSTLRS